MKRVTIYDVAKEAEVSLATVSRVMNSSHVVRLDTRQRVEAAIEKLGYKPNAIAQGLALRKTTTIALVIPEDSLFYTGQIINGLIDVAKIYKYNIMLHTASEGISDMEEIIENIIKSRADGVIMFYDGLNIDQDKLNAFTKYQVPVVMIGNKVDIGSVGSVYVNYKKMVMDLVANYIKAGKKKINFVEDRKNPLISEEIEDGIAKAYKDAGLSYEGMIKIPKEYRSSYAYLQEYFKKQKDLDLVLAYRDSQAIAVLNSARENQINIPQDMELVSILDGKYNAMARPQISGFKIPEYDLGAVSMRLITKMLADEENDDIDPIKEKDIELSYIFNARKSTK